jgi:hypothetical protein
MKAIAEVSRRMLSVLRMAPDIGTSEWASSIAGVFGESTATVSPRLMPE